MIISLLSKGELLLTSMSYFIHHISKEATKNEAILPEQILTYYLFKRVTKLSLYPI